ncbi:hypothetical protein M2451_000156 [Dysgonomonas sp. PFB1-18]|uniref:hypothetical protein n=1 Tax=unclassified Dysgonomonas TaxID=2630389 RepID=UPI002474B9DB|nr:MULTISPECIES: hypothetical protein [unclassified Dysgonomonas]MDH6307707.1 hypothetical protein [Dysgonomonas sp. PF1-14]MDH6337625.1 hypothetical protein [Dysgonomonas sp. PF1-16]MDH6378849.1 hypothetical protein [Dysgonomonas sp. PFB1-18]MDH6396484.1 hypothetical protein [Dysgonomonas sp. PF1-23]
MKKILVIIFFTTLLFTACGTMRVADVYNLSPGMTQNDVNRIMGTPLRILSSSYTQEGRIEVYEYHTYQNDAYAVEFLNGRMSRYDFMYEDVPVISPSPVYPVRPTHPARPNQPVRPTQPSRPGNNTRPDNSGSRPDNTGTTRPSTRPSSETQGSSSRPTYKEPTRPVNSSGSNTRTRTTTESTEETKKEPERK